MKKFTKVSSATSSKFTTDTTLDVNTLFKGSKQSNIYVVVAQRNNGQLKVQGMYLGDKETQVKVSVFDAIREKEIRYNLVEAANKKNVKAFIKVAYSSGNSVYLVKAARDIEPKYEFIALTAVDNEDTVSEVYMDDDLYFLRTREACFDFRNSAVKELSC